MSRHTPLLPRGVTLVALLTLAPAFRAQVVAQPPSGPSRPAVVFLVREVVKPGHDAMHLRHEAEWAAALSRAGVNTPSLGMVSTSGASEAWWMLAYPSFDAMGKDQAAISSGPGAAVMEKFGATDAAHIDSWRSMTLALRPDLSKGTPSNMALARGMEVTTWRIRPGHDPQFVETTNLYAALAQRANVPVHFATYDVAAGGAWGTYLTFTAISSAADFDRMQAESQKIFGAATAEEMARLNAFLKESVMSAETNRFMFDPNISMPPEPFLAQDAAFWTPSWKNAAARPAARR